MGPDGTGSQDVHLRCRHVRAPRRYGRRHRHQNLRPRHLGAAGGPCGAREIRGARGGRPPRGPHGAGSQTPAPRTGLVRPRSAAISGTAEDRARHIDRADRGERRRRHGQGRAQPHRCLEPAQRVPVERERPPRARGGSQPGRQGPGRHTGQQGPAAAPEGLGRRAGCRGVPQRAGLGRRLDRHGRARGRCPGHRRAVLGSGDRAAGPGGCAHQRGAGAAVEPGLCARPCPCRRSGTPGRG